MNVMNEVYKSQFPAMDYVIQNSDMQTVSEKSEPDKIRVFSLDQLTQERLDAVNAEVKKNSPYGFHTELWSVKGESAVKVVQWGQITDADYAVLMQFENTASDEVPLVKPMAWADVFESNRYKEQRVSAGLAVQWIHQALGGNTLMREYTDLGEAVSIND